jgi:hypothetical protein
MTIGFPYSNDQTYELDFNYVTDLDAQKVINASDEEVVIGIDATEPAVINCDHDWVHKAGAEYRMAPVEICTKCYAERTDGLVSPAQTDTEICASVTSDELPVNECDCWSAGFSDNSRKHGSDGIAFTYCPKCGEKL